VARAKPSSTEDSKGKAILRKGGKSGTGGGGSELCEAKARESLDQLEVSSSIKDL
jgi:hypothetical protein